ncbi:MAG: shikimate kinase [Lachnospiraceae bacterium]|jgi:shikimate kinase
MDNSVVLIGFMGAGKTTVGRLVSEHTSVPFTDLDEYIEAEQGCTVSEIFERHGEDYFRVLETEALQKISSDGRPHVLACGGGTPLREENRRIMKRIGLVVWLQVEPETVAVRLKDDTTRPLLVCPDPVKKISTLLSEREQKYRAACDIEFPVDSLTPEKTAGIIEILLSEGGGSGS